MNQDTAKPANKIKRVAILFAGGPAPAANAVISTAATSFMRNGIQVIGVLHGYKGLQRFGPDRPILVGRDYKVIEHQTLARSRNSQGILIGTARANPGKLISQPDHFNDPERVAPLKRVYEALCSLEVDALVSIGGDDTLKTANKFRVYQEQLGPEERRIPVVHVPKTIDNDYMGIDFTFGYFTAVETLAAEIRNVLYDAEATGSYFVAETMGRSAGWLAYGAAIAGEASLVLSVEDICGDLADTEPFTGPDGETTERTIMHVDRVIEHITDVIVARDEARKNYGVIVLAEGLAELLPSGYLEGISRDDHGHISVSDVSLGRKFAQLITDRARERGVEINKVNGIQLGYESRCARPQAFDVMLGSQLGVGAYRALVEEQLNGVMVSVVGQLELRYVPFDELIDPATLVTRVRFIPRGSDFHRLARFLELFNNQYNRSL
ncbi:MAG: 6-phosphofructokinase [Planctomycetota bacterium]